LGGELFDWAEHRAAQLAAERHPAETEAVFRTAGGRDPDPDAAEDAPLTGGSDVRPLLAQRGYRRARSWLVMIRGLPGAALPSIEREQVRVIAPADEHAEATRLAHLAAFADHWGSAPVSSERWNRWWSAHTARRDLSSIALDADAIGASSWLVMIRGLPGAALPSIEREQVRVIAPADEHAEATRLAHLAAFADHWGSAPVSSERWNRWWSAHTARRDLSSIALDAE